MNRLRNSQGQSPHGLVTPLRSHSWYLDSLEFSMSFGWSVQSLIHFKSYCSLVANIISSSSSSWPPSSSPPSPLSSSFLILLFLSFCICVQRKYRCQMCHIFSFLIAISFQPCFVCFSTVVTEVSLEATHTETACGNLITHEHDWKPHKYSRLNHP